MEHSYLLVLTTCPDAGFAEALAAKLVDAGLAACVNIVPGIQSVYRWKGKRETGTERLLLIKTRAALYTRLEQAITESHPYELPEVLAVPIKNGLAGYLSWIDEVTSGAGQEG
ncbi:MAG: periplasmic divalent cation tolerance protein [Gammaproteobacteria bacterium]|nr:MAG: periplasmic divalent cation tolerance protein [Gammaproteobacteria bacterium]TND05830.1 MAG: periplasmic divalent cation tolerance protein [Gammaproteobacteria bacterium]